MFSYLGVCANATAIIAEEWWFIIMTYNKPMVVAKADLKMALKVRYVKYSMIAAGLFGPIFAVGMIVLIIPLVPPSELGMLLSILNPMIAPMLGIFAIIPTTLISANALVGERELKTMEPLLCTPLTDRELLWGKTLGSVIPSFAILFGSTIVTLLASMITFMVIGADPILIPDLPGLFLLMTAVPLMIFAIVAIMIIISGRVTRVYEAYQSSGLLVMVFMIPMFLPFMNLGTGLPMADAAWFANIITLLLTAAIFVVSWAIAFKQFNRDRLVAMV